MLRNRFQRFNTAWQSNAFFYCLVGVLSQHCVGEQSLEILRGLSYTVAPCSPHLHILSIIHVSGCISIPAIFGDRMWMICGCTLSAHPKTILSQHGTHTRQYYHSIACCFITWMMFIGFTNETFMCNYIYTYICVNTLLYKNSLCNETMTYKNNRLDSSCALPLKYWALPHSPPHAQRGIIFTLWGAPDCHSCRSR